MLLQFYSSLKLSRVDVLERLFCEIYAEISGRVSSQNILCKFSLSYVLLTACISLFLIRFYCMEVTWKG